MKLFFSQQGEDVYVYKNYINQICPDGVFVELGAMDGLCYSNTKFFEDELKMSGVLIEPTYMYTNLVRNRPACKCHNVAINKTTEFVKFIGNSATAGLVETMHEKFRSSHHKGSMEYYVQGEPISSVLEKSNIKYIDFFSIDVEGGEEVVLSTMNFNIPVYVICIELDGCNAEKDERCRQILMKHGFIFDRRMNINEFWVNPLYHRKDLLFDKTIPFTLDGCGFIHLASHVAPEVQQALMEPNKFN